MAKKQAEAASAPSVEKKPALPPLVKYGIIMLVLLTIAVIGVFGYRFYTLQQKTGSNVSLSSQPKELVSQVGKLIELPLNEEPTIATVSDVQKLKGQAFFVHAQNGDKVLIYKNAKKAILFRPATGKIVDVGPVNIDNSQVASASSSAEQANASPKPAENEKVTVAIYNGTKRSGLTTKARDQLKDKYPAADVTDRTNAKNDYKETVVVDVTGKQKNAAAAIAKVVGGKVAPLPKGEASTSAAILIILGDNYQAE